MKTIIILFLLIFAVIIISGCVGDSKTAYCRDQQQRCLYQCGSSPSGLPADIAGEACKVLCEHNYDECINKTET